MKKPLLRLIAIGSLFLFSIQIKAQQIISGVSAGTITESSAIISWSTSQPGNSQVYYGTTTSYGLYTLVDSTLAISHSLILYGLAPATTYHFQVRSGGAGGNPSTSGDNTFTTASLASSLGSLNGHTVFAYPSGKIVSWTPNPTNGYDTVVDLAWNYLLNIVPNDPSTGKPAYYSRSYINPNTQQMANWDHNPAGLYGMLTESALKYFAYSGNTNVMQLANDVALWHLDHGMTTASDSWASVPYSEGAYGSLTYSGANQADGVGNLEPDKIGELGYAWLQLYKYNGNIRFRDAAIQCGTVLTNKIRAGSQTVSPWPFRVRASNGNVIEDYCSNVIGPISLLDGLIAAGLGNVSAYQTVRTSAWNWMMNFPMQNNVWAQYFEDVGNQGSYNNNLNQYNAMMVARYLLEHPEYDANWQTHASGLITWVKNNFGQSSLGSTIISEQEVFFYPMGSHTSRFASVNALYYEKTGNAAYKEEAYRSFNWATYMCKSNSGIVIDGPAVDNQWFTDGYGDYIRHIITGLAAVPEWSPANQTHLLRSSSVVKSVNYGLNTVDYTTYDGTAVDVLHVNFNPVTITANGVALPHRADLSQPGWTLDVQTKTLKIYHVNATQISINTQAPGALPVTLGEFTGTINNNSVSLEWKTYSEFNSKEFVVERSIDGVNFEAIHTVTAAGSSASTRVYSVIDNNLPQKLILYYRLKQVDIDGQYQYSKVVRLRFNKGSFYINNISPAPASDVVHLDITNVGTTTNCTVSFVSMNGATLKKSTIILNKGDNIIDFNISSLSKGVYFLKINNNETEVVQKFIKQ